MNKTVPIYLVLLALATGLLVAAQGRPSKRSSAGSSIESALRKLDDAELEGIRKRELKFVDTVYAPDVTLFPIYGLKAEGMGAARDAWQLLYDRFATIKQCDWSERVYHPGAPTSAWMTCLWHLEGSNSDGQELDLVLRVTRHYEKRQGRWRVVHEHFSPSER